MDGNLTFISIGEITWPAIFEFLPEKQNNKASFILWLIFVFLIGYHQIHENN